MPQVSQRHPSRDPRPAEWTPAEGGFNFRPGGFYQADELPHMSSFWHAEGNPAEGHHMTRPSQGTLFDADAHEAKVRHVLGERRMEASDPWGDEYNVERGTNIRNEALRRSVIPTSHLQPRGRGIEESSFIVEDNLSLKGAAGHYTGPADKWRSDHITVDPELPGVHETVVHEMGHRRHLGTTPSFDPRTTHPRGRFPDPLMEAVADAYEDRYGGPGNSQVREMQRWKEGGASPFRAYQHTGYSTDPELSANRGWDPQDRAVYAAARAHASETGEIPEYVPRSAHVMENTADAVTDRAQGNPTMDATLHNLMSNSPHAAQALRATCLKDVGAEAFRRHRDRQLLSQGQNVQLHMFDELRGENSGAIHGYTPSEHAYPSSSWRDHIEHMTADANAAEERSGEFVWPQSMSHNQFGETPRRSRDVRESLGVATRHANKMGFQT